MEQISERVKQLFGHSVYIDANIFIYFLDGREPFYSMARPFLQAVIEGDIRGITEEAVIAEVMVHPYRLGDVSLIENFREFFFQDDFLTIVQHDAQAFDLAAQISGKKSIKLIDSLHLATAVQAECSYLLTNDQKMKPVENIEIFPLVPL